MSFYFANMKQFILVYRQFTLFVLSYIIVTSVFGFNIDEKHAVILKGQDDSYFGYSVAILRNKWILVGAPTDDDPTLTGLKRTGGVYKCSIPNQSNTVPCTMLKIDGKDGYDNLNGEVVYHHKEGQWLGADIQVPNNPDSDHPIVTCAHRWINRRYESQYQMWYQPGMCFMIPQTFLESTVKPIAPLVNDARRYVSLSTGIYEFDYGMGEMGMSVHYTEKDDHVLIGAPGVMFWTGTIVDVNVETSRAKIMAVDVSKHENKTYGQLAGTAVTSGNYFGQELYYVVGIPRSNLNGEVKLFRAASDSLNLDEHDIQIDGKDTKNEELPWNSYFGSSMCTCDVNADGVDDLLLGAPMYSPVAQRVHRVETLADEVGLVLLYIGSSNKTEFRKPKQSLMGRKVTYARFGAAISNLGDINNDGFNDIAIGAPYEDDQGAVYIYNGFRGGLWSAYTQRIAAKSLSSQLKGFGISLAKGNDINSDLINDLVVGSYLSNRAVVLYSQPVLDMKAEMTLVSKSSNVPIKFIELDGSGVILKACFIYTYSACSSIRIQINFHLDANKHGQERMLFRENMAPELQVSLLLQNGLNSCYQNDNFFVKPFASTSSAIVIKAIYDLESVVCPDRPITPAIRRFDGRNPNDHRQILQSEVDFKKECDNNVCRTDLAITAQPEYGLNKDYFTIGNTNMNLTVEINKTGDPAYGSSLYIALPSYIQYRNVRQLHGDIMIDCFIKNASHTVSNSSSHNTNLVGSSKTKDVDIKSLETDHILICALGNLMQNDTGIRATIFLTVPMYVGEQMMNISLLATTLSEDMDESNNKVTLQVPLKLTLEAQLTGVSPTSSIFLKPSVQSHTFEHIYELVNHGPSVLSTASVVFYIPQILDSNSDVLFLVQTRIQCSPPCQTVCSIKGQLIGTMKTIRVNEKDAIIQIPTNIIKRTSLQNEDCSTVNCTQLVCSVKSLNPNLYAVVYLVFKTTDDIKKHMKGNTPLIILSKAEASIDDDRIISDKRSYLQKLVTDVIPIPPESTKFAWWMAVASGAGGLLIIVIIVVVLYVAGFFKRTKLDELNRRKTVFMEQERRSMAMMVEAERRRSAAVLETTDTNANSDRPIDDRVDQTGNERASILDNEHKPATT